MDKWQTQQAFWGSFGIPAYDEQAYYTKGDVPSFPHLTYQAFGGRIGQSATLSVNLWYREQTGASIKLKANEIFEYMSEREPICIPMDEGFLWIKVPETIPFAQPIGSGSNDELIKRILLTVEAECLSNF